MKTRPLFSLLLLVLFTFSHTLYAQERRLLYSKSLSGPLQEYVRFIADPHGRQVLVEDLPPPLRYFVRILPRKYVLDDKNEITDSAVLANSKKPFAFLTTPESVFGRSLLDIYADIGYEAEDIINWQRNEDMVLVLFRYDDNVTLSPVKNGRFGSEWPNGIYSTTWDNIISLFTRLAKSQNGPACSEKHDPAKYFCLPPTDAEFVNKFPPTGKRDLKTKTYIQLKAAGGPTWRYRYLLENQLSVFEHFRGDGRTENELIDLKMSGARPRLQEVVGPNVKLKSLPEVAVIHLGKLVIGDCYTDGGKDLPQCN